MKRRKSFIGALLLCALGVCAFAANASATTMHECKTGGGGTGVKYTDSTCSVPSGTGTFETVTPPENTPVSLTPTATENFVWHFVNTGAEFTIECTTLTGSGEAQNIKDAAKVMQVHGTKIKLKFSGCTVTKPAGKGCTATVEEITALTSLTETVAGVTKVKFTPEVGETFTNITVASCSVGGLNGLKPVKGTFTGIVGPNATSLQFTETSGSALTIGGQKANLTGKTHSVTQGTGTLVSIESP